MKPIEVVADIAQRLLKAGKNLIHSKTKSRVLLYHVIHGSGNNCVENSHSFILGNSNKNVR